jgi:hypothetical protein
LPVSGDYFVAVRAFAANQPIGRYRLSISLTPCSPKSEAGGNPSLATATPIVTKTIPVGARLAAIAATGQQDYYSVELASVTCLHVSVDADPERDGTSTDVLVELLDENGVPVLTPAPASAGAGSASAPSAVSFVLALHPGSPLKYHVRVRHAAALTGTGTYCLMVRRDGPEVEPNLWFSAPPLDPLYRLPDGSSFAQAAGSLTAGDADFYKLRTPAPGGGRVWLLADTGGPGSGSRDSVLSLTHDELDLTPLETDDDDGTGTGGDETIEALHASAIAGLSVSSDFTRLVNLRAFSAAQIIDSYTLYAVVTTGAPALEGESNDSAHLATPIVDATRPLGLRVGTIGAAGDMDFYSVEMAEGEIMFASLDCNPPGFGVGGDLALDLIAPDKTTPLLTADSSGVGSAGDRAAESFSYRARAAGRYFVVVRHHSVAGTGAYLLMVARNNTALRILSASVAGASVTLNFTTMPERRYRVQFTDALTDHPVWTTLPHTVPGSGLLQGYTHVNGATQPHRFYRVMQVP